MCSQIGGALYTGAPTGVRSRDQHIYLYAFALTGEKRVLNDG